MKFLSAQWNHLLMANYSVSSECLAPYVPHGTQLDEFEGHNFVSLVAFMFDKTSVLGIPALFHRRFEEVNLRFYVTPKHDPAIRAVTFIKELVPKAIIPLIANTLFDENYQAVRMAHEISGDSFSYRWGPRLASQISARIESDPEFPAANSINEFITEHYWGYTKGAKRTLQYEVQHPQWKCCEVDSFEIAVDYEANYGSDFGFLNDLSPHNVIYARGSDVNVLFPSKLKPV